MRQNHWRTGVLTVALGAGTFMMVLPSAASAQYAGLSLSGEDLLYEENILQRPMDAVVPLMANPGGRYVVVHLAENRVYVFEGEHAIWSANAGTGTGLQLDRGDRNWQFSTPKGLFKVKKMERDPVWEAPDWHWLERGQRPPPMGHPSRSIRGGMGNTAVYLGDGIAIHGTESPQQLLNPDPDARRISHGCIRLTNESARELMHLVDVGTPVLIY